MKHDASYSEQSVCDVGGQVALGQIRLGGVKNGAAFISADGGRPCAVMSGEVYNYTEKRAALEECGCRCESDSQTELLVRGYETMGNSFFRDAHGSYVVAMWDRARRKVVVVNDRFGMRPLYYAKARGRFVLASEIKALRRDPAVSARWCLRGTAQFFTFGQLLGEETLLEGVRVLPAGTCLIYDLDSGRVTMERCWVGRAHAPSNGRTGEELVEGICEAFARSVDRRVRDTEGLGLSLSGGLDARTILAAIDHERVPITTVSIGIAGSLDHRSASELSGLTNRRHHCYTLDDRFLGDFERHVRRMVHLTDGQYLSQCIVMPTLPVYRELGIKVLMRGHGGELMHMDKAYNFSLDREALGIRDETELEAWLFRHLQAYMLQQLDGPLFAPEYQPEIESQARESLRSCLEESAGIEPPLQRVWHLFLMQRLRRETALSLVKFNSVVEVRLPYLDNDLVELLLAAPPELKLGDQIQSRILRRHRPEFLNVVNSNTGTRLGAGPWRRRLATARMRLLGKLGVRGYQPYERLGRWLRQELRGLVQRVLLVDRCLGRGIFDPQAIRRVASEHWNGRRNHTFLLMALMIFELGQREFVDGEGLEGAGTSGSLEVTAGRG
jgi:asparagine synthase (glutamine-hydrolysing)